MKVYNDSYSRGQFDRIEQHLRDALKETIGPEYMLTNVGFSKDFSTDDITVKLHLKKLDRIKEIEKQLGITYD